MQTIVAFLLSINFLLSQSLSPVLPLYPLNSAIMQDTSEESDTNDSEAGTSHSSVTDSTGLSVSAPSVLLMEASTGTILYEKDSHSVLRPASITKIMTLILIFDALTSGKISLDETVTTSEYASSMGGSQVFLEAGEVQTVETLIKCICVASANDACVTMAEYLSGSEDAFVAEMNARAQGLGMTDTHFVNCCGLDVDDHMTSAYDVALMSRELITKYPQIHDYTTIWMEDITHTTAKGSSTFTLTNTNKLIRQYEYATGLKTGSTSLAKYCVSATATKDGVELIAVVMAAPDYKVRFQDAATLLNYGFSHCALYEDPNTDTLPTLPVNRGVTDTVSLRYENSFSYVDTSGLDLSGITKEFSLPDKVNAPIKAGDIAGTANYILDGKVLGSVNLLYNENVEKATFRDYFFQIINTITMVRTYEIRSE